MTLVKCLIVSECYFNSTIWKLDNFRELFLLKEWFYKYIEYTSYYKTMKK